MNDQEFIHVVSNASAGMSIMSAFKIPKNNIIRGMPPITYGTHELTGNYKSWRAERHKSLAYQFEVEGDDPESQVKQFENDELLFSDQPLLFWLDENTNSQLVFCLFAHFLLRNSQHQRVIHELQYISEDDPTYQLPRLVEPELIRLRPERRVVPITELENRAKFWKNYVGSDQDKQISCILHPNINETADKALNALKYSYPEKSTGLNTVQFSLLKLAQAHQPSTVGIIGWLLREPPNMAIESDLEIYDHVLELGCEELKAPLFTFAGDVGCMRDHDTLCTAFAIRLLEGKENFLETNDRWPKIGGVQLSKSEPWYQENFEITG